MPRGRFLSKEISLDEKVNNLSDDTARLLFTWLIPHLDCEGRLHGDAMTVRSIIFPRRSISTKRIEKYLNEFEKNGLIIRYGVNGNTYLFAPHFEKHQIGLQKNKEAQSQIPPPTPELRQSNDREGSPQVEVEVKAEVVEGSDNNLKELLALNGWGPTQLDDDKEWLEEFIKEYPMFNLGHIKGCRDFHSGKTKQTKALWKTRLRNWMKTELKHPEANGSKKRTGDDGWPI